MATRLSPWRLLALGVAVMMLAVACDDDGGGDSDGATTTTGANPATGEPVKVMTIYDESEASGLRFDTARAGAEARVQAINGDGGLGGSGRPIEIVECVTELDTNRAAACARDAAADPEIVAVVGGVLGNGDVVNPVLEEAGLANVGGTAFSASDGTSQISFPVMGGLIAATGGQASILADEADATEIGVAYSDTPGSEQSVTLADLVLQERGLSVTKSVEVPVAKPDVSSEVSSLLADSDAIMTASDGETAKKVIRTVRQQGSDLPIAGSGAQQYTPEAIEALGSAVEGLYLALWFATDTMPGEGVESYVADMEAIGKADQSDDLAKNSWLAFDLLDVAAESAATLDRAGILTALSQISAFDTGGLTPVLDFTTPGPILGGAQPRLVNPTVVYARVDDGTITALKEEFVNPFDVPNG